MGASVLPLVMDYHEGIRRVKADLHQRPHHPIRVQGAPAVVVRIGIRYFALRQSLGVDLPGVQHLTVLLPALQLNVVKAVAEGLAGGDPVLEVVVVWR